MSTVTRLIIINLYEYNLSLFYDVLHHGILHLSNVLTDHFSNSLFFVKTTNDMHMIFLQCHFHFKTIFYRLPLPNREIS